MARGSAALLPLLRVPSHSAEVWSGGGHEGRGHASSHYWPPRRRSLGVSGGALGRGTRVGWSSGNCVWAGEGDGVHRARHLRCSWPPSAQAAFGPQFAAVWRATAGRGSETASDRKRLKGLLGLQERATAVEGNRLRLADGIFFLSSEPDRHVILHDSPRRTYHECRTVPSFAQSVPQAPGGRGLGTVTCVKGPRRRRCRRKMLPLVTVLLS